MRRGLLLLAALPLLSGCGLARKTVKTTAKVTYGTAKLATKVAVGTVVVAGKAVKGFAYYTARAAIYAAQHDGGGHDTSAPRRVIARKYQKLPDYKGEYRWPLTAGLVSSEFGPRWRRKHEGIDIAADEGEPVMASASGTVLYSDSRMRGYGNVVIVRHDGRTTTLYAHNQELKVRHGEKVEQGQVIALLGNTGSSTGPHVHFELRKDNVAVDPRRLLPKSEF